MNKKDKYIQAMNEIKFKEFNIDNFLLENTIKRNQNSKIFYKTCVSLVLFQVFFLLVSTSSCYYLGGII